jgi:hypothetical protein
VSYIPSTILVVNRFGRKCVKVKQFADKDRKELETKLANVFDTEINSLSTELREILLDDMVTAFENRLNVLKNAEQIAAN